MMFRVEFNAVMANEGQWTIIGLQHNLAAQGPTPIEAVRRLAVSVASHYAICRETGRPEVLPGPSPVKYWELWDSAPVRAEFGPVPLEVGGRAIEVMIHFRMSERAA